MNRVRKSLALLASTRIGQIGVALSTAAGITIGTLFLADFFGVRLGPYAGIVGFIGLPALLVIGLFMIAAGLARRGVVTASPEIIRQTAAFIGVMTVVNLLFLLSASYKAIHYMDSTQFCGQTCHVMRPQFLAHEGPPHAKIPCTECHVAAGVGGMIDAKMAGARQLVLYLTGKYSRPVHGEAKETCASCHTPPVPGSEKLVNHVHFGDDEKNTPSSAALSVHTGSIHKAHSTEACAFCHNRVGHASDSPEETVEAALQDGRLDRTVPYMKKRALAALISGASAPGVAAAKTLAEIRSRHVFPEMRVDWGTYPNNLGHHDGGGCFRCHDGGKARNDCDTCHSFLEIKGL